MSVLRKRLDSSFTIVPNELLDDPDLDLAAKGLVALMLSKPDGWNFNALRLSKSLPEGRDAIRAAQNRAVEAGWVVIVDERSQTGEFHRVILVRNSRQVPWEIVGVPDPGLPDPGEVGPGVTVAVSKNLEASTEIASTEVQDLAPAKPPRPRDPIWDALVEIYGEPTSAGRGAMNTAAKALRDYGATPDEIFVTVSGLGEHRLQLGRDDSQRARQALRSA